jgi:hypothetical protein
MRSFGGTVAGWAVLASHPGQTEPSEDEALGWEGDTNARYTK